MASNMAVAAAHAMPPFPLPAIPRVRPPPIPKGTPGPNTLPMPITPRPPKSKHVWADGKWVVPSSSSAKHKSEVVSRQLEKALQHEVHGMNIYAYRHINTNQVVYSLTKNMDNNKMLKQLLFHGKQTAPAALRRDEWRPYYSIHFPKTPAGAHKGLRVYHELRELSLQRQVSPPKALTRATEEDIERIKKGYGPAKFEHKLNDDSDIRRGAHHRRLNVPIPGARLPPKMLAKRLMDQKASSVADTAAVLTRLVTARTRTQRKNMGEKVTITRPLRTPQQKLALTKAQNEYKEIRMSAKALKRLTDIRQTEAEKALELKAREEILKQQLGDPRIDKHALVRINNEYGRALATNLLMEKDRATENEIGAEQKLQAAMAEIEVEKTAQADTIEEEITAQIERRSADMSDTERAQVLREFEAAKVQALADFDTRVKKEQKKYTAKREQMQKDNPTPTPAQQAEMHKLKNQASRVLADMKTKEERSLNWVGPYKEIATAVEKAQADIDKSWEKRLTELQEQAKEQRKKRADSSNHEVEIRWADIRDGTYAREWPDSVVHAEFRAKAHLDSGIASPPGMMVRMRAAPTVHVFGTELPEDLDPDKLLEEQLHKVQGRVEANVVRIRDRMLALRRSIPILERKFRSHELEIGKFGWLSYCIDAVGYARDALSQYHLELDSESLQSLYQQLDYIREEMPVKKKEEYQEMVKDSLNPAADLARIYWVKFEAETIELEEQYPAAAAQANRRLEFLAKVKELESLEHRQNSTDYLTRTRAIEDLETFNIEHSDILEIRRNAQTTAARMADLKEQIQSQRGLLSLDIAGQVGQKDKIEAKIASLREEMKDTQKRKESKETQHWKHSGLAWEYVARKSADTQSTLWERSGMQQRQYQHEHEQEEEVVQVPGLWTRITSVFKRR